MTSHAQHVSNVALQLVKSLDQACPKFPGSTFCKLAMQYAYLQTISNLHSSIQANNHEDSVLSPETVTLSLSSKVIYGT